MALCCMAKFKDQFEVVGRQCKPLYKARPMEILMVANLAGITQSMQPDSIASPVHTPL
jgi:hypothetical protein